MQGECEAMSGDTYKRIKVSPNEMQCGCRWERQPGFGDVLIECPIHRQAGAANLARFERERDDR